MVLRADLCRAAQDDLTDTRLQYIHKDGQPQWQGKINFRFFTLFFLIFEMIRKSFGEIFKIIRKSRQRQLFLINLKP